MKKEIILYTIILDYYKENLELELARYEKEISDTEAAMNDGYVDYTEKREYQNEITAYTWRCSAIKEKLTRVNEALNSENKIQYAFGLEKVRIFLDNDELRDLNKILESKKKITKNNIDNLSECLESDISDFDSLTAKIDAKSMNEIVLSLINNSQHIINETIHLEQPVSVKQYTK